MQVDSRACGAGGHPAGLAGRVPECVDVGVDPDLDACGKRQPSALGKSAGQPLGIGQNRAAPVSLRGEHGDRFASKAKPGQTARSETDGSAGVVEREDFAVGTTVDSHLLRAALAQADSVPGAGALEDEPPTFEGHLVQVVMQSIPSDAASEGQSERARADLDLLAVSAEAERAGAAGGGSRRNDDAFDIVWRAQVGACQCRSDLVTAGDPSPCSSTGAGAVWVGVAGKIGRYEVRPNGARVFGLAAAVPAVAGEGELALEPEQLASRLLRGGLKPRRHGAQVHPLAVRGGAEIESLRGVPSTQAKSVGARRNGLRLERFF